jgi:hypothetical protein
MSEPWWSMQRSTENKEDHSSEWMEKCAQKVFDRAGIVRDVREPDYTGVTTHTLGAFSILSRTVGTSVLKMVSH